MVEIVLRAEENMERHDPDVVEALTRLRLGEVGGRVEHDRGVVGRQVHGSCSPRSLADVIARTRSSIGLPFSISADGSGGEHRAPVGIGRLGGEADDGCVRRRREDGCGRAGSVEPREAEVHQHDVGIVRLGGRRGLVPRRDRADDLDAVTAVEQQLERRPVDLVVLDEQHPHDRAHSAESSSG